MGSKRFVSAIEMGGSGSLSRMPTSGESRYGAPNFVVGTDGGHLPKCNGKSNSNRNGNSNSNSNSKCGGSSLRSE